MKGHTLSRRQFLKAAAAFTAATALPNHLIAKPGPRIAGRLWQEIAPGVPREECLILENPSGTVSPADDFNRWRAGYSGVWVCGLQQLALDALWYIDPDAGVDGVWDNALAAEPPIYNCLLYTSDAADDLLCVDLGGRRIIKKKQHHTTALQ